MFGPSLGVPSATFVSRTAHARNYAEASQMFQIPSSRHREHECRRAIEATDRGRSNRRLRRRSDDRARLPRYQGEDLEITPTVSGPITSAASARLRVSQWRRRARGLKTSQDDAICDGSKHASPVRRSGPSASAARSQNGSSRHWHCGAVSNLATASSKRAAGLRRRASPTSARDA
jgi:hypothetical protein